MRFSTLLQYLCGRREAILAVANCRYTVWLGLLFVISAGFAREYDGEDLLHEPWHLFLPMGASLVTSFLLFDLLQIAFPSANQDESRSGNYISKYRAFLGLYWMTAPLAWLYAVPVERFLDAPDAVLANLWMLGIVSVWRVTLMTRIVEVIYGRSAMAAFFAVMLFADSVALVVFWLTPLPILQVMGGIRLTESERVLQSTGFLIRFLGTVMWPVWFVGVWIAAVRGRKHPDGWGDVNLQHSEWVVAPSLWVLAASSLFVWAAVLPSTQPEQVNRRQVESDLLANRLASAIEYMSQRSRGDFPPHWDPPPHFAYGDRRPSLVDVLLQLESVETAPWVHEMFREKLRLQSSEDGWNHYEHAIRLADMEDERLARYVKLLKSLPEAASMARYHEFEIQHNLESGLSGREGDSEKLSEERRALLEDILTLIPKKSRRTE